PARPGRLLAGQRRAGRAGIPRASTRAKALAPWVPLRVPRPLPWPELGESQRSRDSGSPGPKHAEFLRKRQAPPQTDPTNQSLNRQALRLRQGSEWHRVHILVGVIAARVLDRYATGVHDVPAWARAGGAVCPVPGHADSALPGQLFPRVISRP